MMRVILNGNGTTQLWDLVKHFIKPGLLDDETIDAELKDVEEVYKREAHLENRIATVNNR